MMDFLLGPASVLVFWRRDQIRCGAALRRAQRRLKKNRDRAEELFELALSFGVTDSRPYVQYASALLEQGQMGRAIEMLHDAVEVEPQSPVPLIFLGLALSDAARQQEALSALHRACEQAPANLFASSSLSLAQMRSGRVVSAANDLLGRGIADNLGVRARLLAAVEGYLRGEGGPRPLDDLLPPAVESEEPAVPPRASGRRCFKDAVKAVNKGRYKTARALLSAAAQREHDTDEVRLYLAGSLMGLGEYQEAAERLSAIRQSRLLRGAALFYAGVCQYLSGEAGAALELLGQAAETGSVYDFEELIHYYRGLSLLAVGGDELAVRREFLRALDIDWTLLPRRLEAAVGSSRPSGLTGRPTQ